MEQTNVRDYKCKDEELPSICMFSFTNLKRDLVDFTGFSPRFNADYLTGYETRIFNASRLIQPESETLALKIISRRLLETFNSLLDLMNRLTGYITLAKLEQSISLADFGIKYMRKSVNAHDPEGVIEALHTILGNINTYKAELQAQGMSDDFTSRLNQVLASVTDDKLQQVAIISNRRHIVQNNVGSFNGLYGQLNEILTVGKILYKSTNIAKLSDYTFSELIKHVRHNTKQKPPVQKVPVN